MGVAALAARRPFRDRPATVADARRHARRISIAALGVGALGAAVAGFAGELHSITGSSAAGRLGVAAISMPLAFGLAHTGTLLVGEVTWPKPAGNVRRARLVRRGLLDSVPRWLLRLAEGILATGVAIARTKPQDAARAGHPVTLPVRRADGASATEPFAID